MESQIPYSVLFTFLSIFLLVLHKKLSFSNPKKSSKTKTLPPSPFKLPLIGHLHHLVGSPPHRSLRDLANKYGPIMHLQLGQTSNVVVTSSEIAKDIMKTHDQIFANRPVIFASEVLAYNSTSIAFSPYGNYWRQLRKICTLEILSSRRVQSFRTIREEEVASLVKSIAEEYEGTMMDLGEKIPPLSNSIVARAAFGKRDKNAEKFIATLEYILEIAAGFSISDLYPSLKFLRLISGVQVKAVKIFREIDAMLEEVINKHKEKKGSNNSVNGDVAEEDLVDVLLRVQDENNLTLDNIKAVILDMISAGTETTATTVVWAMSELLRNPETMKKAQDEVRRVYRGKGYVDESQIHHLKYIEVVIKETLRLHPPVVLLVPRENSEDCEINNYMIPRKTKVMINAWAIGRDPKYWNEPDRFQPERFLDSSVDFRGTNFEFIPFGAGRRICPGITFASAAMEIVLASLLYHFDWKLPNGIKPEELDMAESFGITVKRKNSLCVVPISYHP